MGRRMGLLHPKPPGPPSTDPPAPAPAGWGRAMLHGDRHGRRREAHLLHLRHGAAVVHQVYLHIAGSAAPPPLASAAANPRGLRRNSFCLFLAASAGRRTPPRPGRGLPSLRPRQLPGESGCASCLLGSSRGAADVDARTHIKSDTPIFVITRPAALTYSHMPPARPRCRPPPAMPLRPRVCVLVPPACRKPQTRAPGRTPHNGACPPIASAAANPPIAQVLGACWGRAL